MSIETSGSIDRKKAQRGWMIATAVSAVLGGYGINEGFIKPPTDPLRIQCSALSSEVGVLQKELLESGTLGVDGGLVIRYLEIRNPDDVILKRWGALKNRRDKVCAEAQKNYDDSFGGFIKGIGLLGGAFTLLSLRKVLELRKHSSPTP